MRYPFSNNKVQSYGPNGRTLTVTRDIDGQGTLATANLYELLNVQEYLDVAREYSLVKIVGIGVTIYPNSPLANNPTGVYMDWVGANQVLSPSILRNSDMVKIVYNSGVMPKTYYYKPLNANISTVNYQQWQPTQSINLFYTPRVVIFNMFEEESVIRGRIDILVAFRIPVVKDSPQNNKNVIKFLKKDEILEEVKNVPDGIGTSCLLRKSGELLPGLDLHVNSKQPGLGSIAEEDNNDEQVVIPEPKG